MRHRSTALALAWAMAALVVYASLFPFSGWRWPPGVDGLAVLLLPWPPWLDRFDAAFNLLGYMPLGALIYGGVLRGGGRAREALICAVGLSLCLSYAVEVGQQFVPTRVPSLKDCAFNLGGGLLGAGVAAAIQAIGFVERWHRLRERWFLQDSAPALLLMLLWPVALLFPSPAPLGLGHIWGELNEVVAGVLAGTPWADEAQIWLAVDAAQGPLSRLQEGQIIALGLLGPCFVAFATSHPGWHRAWLVVGTVLAGLAAMTLSTALNFGPAHALAWWTAATLPAFVSGSVLALAALGVGRRLAAALGLIALVWLLAMVARAPADPYYAASLQGWEQGRFVRFHGLAQWVGWLWPFAALAWLLGRVTQRGE